MWGCRADTDFIAPQLVAGRWLEAGDDDAIVVNTDVIKDEPNLGVGDTVRLKIRGDEKDWQVVGVVTGQLMGSLVVRRPTGTRRRARRDGGGVTRLLVKTDLAHRRRAAGGRRERLEDRLDEAGFSVAGSETQQRAEGDYREPARHPRRRSS